MRIESTSSASPTEIPFHEIFCLSQPLGESLNQRSAVQHISKQIPDDDRNLIKKGWDQLYMDRIREEGFLSRAREARADWQESQKKAKEKARVEALKSRENDKNEYRLSRDSCIPLIPVAYVK